MGRTQPNFRLRPQLIHKGHKIEAYVKSMESKNWLAQLKQGQTYIVQNFENDPKRVVLSLRNERGCTITCILWGPFAMQLKAWTSLKTTLNLWLCYYTWPKSKNLKERVQKSLESNENIVVSFSQKIVTLSQSSQFSSEVKLAHNVEVKSLSELDDIKKEGKFDPKSMPKALDNVLKKQLAFKIKIVPNSSCYSVLETSQD
ncbi:hypothetical protein HKD37_20G055526 [Glycine soja]